MTAMLPFGNQRWRGRRDLYRPPDEPIRPNEYDVAEIPGDLDAKAFVEAHHYAGTYPAARFRYGLYHQSALAGVAVFSHPCNDRVLTSAFPGDPLDSVELGRVLSNRALQKKPRRTALYLRSCLSKGNRLMRRLQL